MHRICVLFAASAFAAILAAGSPALMVDVQAEEKVEIPAEVREISEELGRQYNICPELIQAICWRESRFAPGAENGDCVGIMQVSIRWHGDRAAELGVTDMMDIRQNMTVAVDYLSELTKAEEDIAGVLMQYHGESDIGEKLNNNDLSQYAQDILALSAILERENGK